MSAIYTKKKFAWIDNHVGSRSAKAALVEVKKLVGVGVFSCSLCAFTCVKGNVLKYHYATKHFQEEILAGIEKTTICGLCGLKSRNKCHLTMHYATKHEYLKNILVRMNIEIDTCETPKGTGLCVPKDKPTSNIRKPSNDSSNKLFTDPVKRIYSQDGLSGLARCDLCNYTSKQNCHLRYHYCTVHYGDDILKEIEDLQFCVLCGRYETKYVPSMIVHYGIKHGFLEEILTRNEKLRKGKANSENMKVGIPGLSSIPKSCNVSTETERDTTIYSRDSTSELVRCDLCDYTSKQNCHLRYHYCTDHFREDILKEIEDLQLCVLCGRFETKSAQSMVVHYGTKHGFLDTILSQRKKLGKDKKMNVDIPGSAEHHTAREPREVPAFQGNYLQEVTAVYGEDEGRPLQEDQVKLEREHQGSKLEPYIFIIHTLLCEWTIFILVFSTHVNKLCDITHFHL